MLAPDTVSTVIHPLVRRAQITQIQEFTPAAWAKFKTEEEMEFRRE
jgi:hypothetical protein